MRMNHLFYDSDVHFKALTWKRVVLSIIIGLASAVLIYSFFYGLREMDRMLFLDFEERPMVVSEGDRQIFNLFFAAISVILGNSIAISFLFAKPQKVFSRRNNKRNRILNDQVFLGLNFIHWLAKVWFLFASFSSEFMGSKFITNFLWPSIFLILVLYLDSWKTLSLIINKGRLKIMGLHFIIFLILTFGLSRLNVIDYKSIDDIVYSARPTVEVPQSTFKVEKYERRYYDNLVFKIDFTPQGQVGLFNEQYEQIELYDVYSYINEWENDIMEEFRYKATPRLRANKNIPIAFIKEFELKLFDYNQIFVLYEVANDDELTKRFYNHQIKHRISPSLNEVFPRKPHEPPRLPYYDYMSDINSTDTIVVKVGKTIEFDNRRVPRNDLVAEFEKDIDSLTVFEYVYTDDITYQDYINVLSAHNEAVLKLKKNNSNINYDQMISEIYSNPFIRNKKHQAELRRLDEKFPLLITERFE